jgi:N-methylhydantoinase B
MKDNVLIDPITYEVIRHRLWSINEEGSATVVHVSGSPVVHSTDYNFGIYTAEGEMAVIGVYLLVPIYTGAMAIREFLNRYDDISPGDVFIINDPFIAAEHQNDVQFCAPFFDNGELVAWLGCMAHQVDLGGMDPGSWCTTATSVYQEGLIIPPGRIVRKGEINQELWNLITSNSRMPFVVSNDFTAFLAGLRVAAERLTELCDRYGSDRVVSVMNQSIDGSEAQLRELLSSVPDGVFEHTSYLDRPSADGGVELLEVPLKLEKLGDRLIFDFSGASPQSPGYGMATRAGTIGAVATAMLCTFGSEVPWNHGIMRPVEVRMPDGLCVTAVSPMPVSGGAAASNWVAMNAACGALGKLLSMSEKYESFAFGPGDGSWQLSQLGGVDQYGQPYAAMYMDSLLWGGPAFSFRDGVDSGGAMVILGGGTQDVEQQEMRQPLLYLWRREVPDSGGAGKFRGGNGIEFALTPIDTDEVIGVLGTHGVELPNRTGIFGGLPGSCARFERLSGTDVLAYFHKGMIPEALSELGGVVETLPGVSPTVTFNSGDAFNCILQNGGGYGDPLLRDSAAVVLDVANKAVSEKVAADIYGVILVNGKVGDTETEHRRSEIRNARKNRMVAPAGVNCPEQPERPSSDAGHWGDALRLAPNGNGVTYVWCAHCEAPLGDLSKGWESLAGRLPLAPEELGPFVKVTDSLQAQQWVCPSCLTALWTDIVPTEGKSWKDFELTGSSQ